MLPKGDTPARVDNVDAPLPVVPEKVDGGVPGNAAGEADGVPVLREGDGAPPRKVQANVDRNETMKAEVADTLEIGSTRKNVKGGVEELAEVPIEMVDDMPGNKIFEDAVAKYQKDPGSIAPELRIQDGGRYLIYDGHHRVEGARRRGDKTIKAWVSRSGPDGYPELPAVEVQNPKENE